MKKLRIHLVSKDKEKRLYYVELNGNKQVIDLDKLLKLIPSIPSSERDCTIRNGAVVKKAGTGRIKTISTGEPRKCENIVIKAITKCPSESANIIICNDAFFDENVADNRKFLTKCAAIIKQFDKASLVLEESTIEIRTPFGLCDITSLSTGCKTILNALVMVENNKNSSCIINSDECGDEAFEFLCKLSSKYNITLLVRVARNVYKLYNKGIRINLDGESISDPDILYNKLWEV